MASAKINSLTLIDGIIGALSRGGPGRGISFQVPKSNAALTQCVRECAGTLGVQEILSKRKFLLTGESSLDALYFARAYIEVIADSVPKFFTLSMEDQLVFYRQASDWPQPRFTTYAKFCTAWPMARFLNNPLPEKPEGFEGNPLFSGKVKRMLKSRIVSKSNRNARLFFGILQGVKRGCAPVSEDFVQQNYEKHRAALSAEPRGKAPDPDYLARYQEMFSEFRYPQERLLEPSVAASFQSKRSEGGAREFIRQEQEEGLIKMYEHRPGEVKKVKGHIGPSFEEAVSRAAAASRKVMVSAVLEPLKVRLITKGDSYRYWISRYYQKSLWSHLQKFPQFVLTGRPLESGDLIDLKAREAALGLDFPSWVSGDYSAATDALDIRHTKAAFEASLRMGLFEARPEVVDVLRSVLYEQEVHYPSKSGLSPVMQTTGQLMGSTLSFPILCVVNLVSYWRSLETYLDREIDIRDLPVLINGDDILFRANADLYDLWQMEVKNVGFELSLGKNYIHDRFLTVNSQLYSDNGKDLTHLGVMNTGILIGQSKITGRQGAKIAPLWDYYNECVHQSVNPIRTHKRFIHYHRRTIERLTLKGQYNLFLPFERGGLGCVPPEGFQPKITSFQRRFATYLEKKFVDDPSVINKIALVSEKNSSKLVLYHEPTWVIGPKIGPLPEGVVEPETREVSLPPLALEGEDTERQELRVRLPRPRTIREFRVGTFRRMGGAIRSFIWRPLEQRLTRFESEDQVEYTERLSRMDKVGQNLWTGPFLEE